MGERFSTSDMVCGPSTSPTPVYYCPTFTNPYITVGGSRMSVTFTNTASNNEPIEIQLSGNWIDRYCTMTWNDMPVAQVTRDFCNGRQVLGDDDTVRFTSCGRSKIGAGRLIVT